MKLSDIIRQVNRDIDETYSNGDIVDWVNRCLDDLTPLVKKEAQTTIPITSVNSYPMPADFYDFAHVFVGPEEFDRLAQGDFNKRGFKLWNDLLSLQNGPDIGTIDLYYYRKLAYLSSTNTDAVPEIDENFHDLLVLYAIGHLQFTEEDYEDRPDLLIRYSQRKAEYEQYLQRKRRKGRAREKVVW